MTRRQNRLVWIGLIGLVLTFAVGLSLFAYKDGIAFALSPAELQSAKVETGDRIRLFGLVKEGSVEKAEGLNVSFVLALEGVERKVRFNDILPDLFREGQGIIVEGSLADKGDFIADVVLAKHDENYIPKEIVDKMKDDGTWRGGDEVDQ